MANYAHINKEVVYAIDNKPQDEKAELDVEITRLNGPYFTVQLSGISGDTLGLSNNGSYYVELFDLIEPGDTYDETNNRFIVNNDKFDGERKIDSYFELKQYKNELNAVNSGLTCTDGYNQLPFYYKSESGTTIIDVPTLYNLSKQGNYEYVVTIYNDGNNNYHNFDMTDALLDKATNSANNTLSICGYTLKEILSPEDIEEL